MSDLFVSYGLAVGRHLVSLPVGKAVICTNWRTPGGSPNSLIVQPVEQMRWRNWPNALVNLYRCADPAADRLRGRSRRLGKAPVIGEERLMAGPAPTLSATPRRGHRPSGCRSSGCRSPAGAHGVRLRQHLSETFRAGCTVRRACSRGCSSEGI
jgi:hypothetical protein